MSTDPNAAPISSPNNGEEPAQVRELSLGGARRSGLRNPGAAVRGIGAAALLLEALALLLALQPVRQFSTLSAPVALSITGVLAVICVVGAGLLRSDWGWRFGIVIQVALVAAGAVHWSLAVLGGIFLVIWLYVLHVRRTVMGYSSIQK